ncbi:23S rRNA (uracil(1939)-C(5))-methyltransferase RlmD [Erysipelothrix aquatica]|uniref:23S rRNA (uracil(1939)-C(5))-methyltransferase RlmD n=1 Tax=Erysipelothrix aquatica TaxID=2683714 RepID=UPI00135B7951|nr:23S rRNA (uracil(1939)-C(5))-methyltransferase RlmD [Erysipelothrix aquatica]
MNTDSLKKNDILELTFIDMSYEGKGVAKVDGYPIFVEGGITGETALVKLDRVEKKYAFGRITELLIPSQDRVHVKSKDLALNSTIPLQHVSYSRQLELKTKIVEDAFKKDPMFKNVLVNHIIGAENEWHYRNKTQVPVRKVDDAMEIGVFKHNSHQLIPVNNFKINALGIDEIVVGIRDILVEFNEKPYDARTNTGNIRHIIVRHGQNTGEVMVILVTRSKSLFPQSKIVPAIAALSDNIVSIIHNVNPLKTAAIMGPESKVVYGKETFKEVILDNTYEVTAESFLQVNTPQAEVLYQTLLDTLQLDGTEVVLDAYSGIGTISLSLAQRAKEVVGIEIVEEAVIVAVKNAEINEISNISFIAGDVIEGIKELSLKPDVVVVDPPRKGLESSFVDDVIALSPEKIAYVSCNPATLVRDLKPFVSAGYNIDSVQPVDMFPQTTHIESIVLLVKSSI